MYSQDHTKSAFTVPVEEPTNCTRGGRRDQALVRAPVRQTWFRQSDLHKCSWEGYFCDRRCNPNSRFSGGTSTHMRYKQPVKQILNATRSYWDRPETRPAVRENFDKVTKYGTLALGAEVFASENEEKKVPHTCKARPCPRCGHRATIQWQREQWCSLPDIPYVGIVLTMPDVLWPIFRQNRHLLHHLPKLGATVIQQWAKLKYGVRLLMMVIPHTFGGYLNFNSHLHVLVSAGGLQESESCWVTSLVFDEDKLMHMWRFAVITFLREVLLASALTSNLSNAELRAVLR